MMAKLKPVVMQRGRAVIACRGSNSHDVRTVTWNVNSMVGRSGDVVLALLCSRDEVERWKCEDVWCYW